MKISQVGSVIAAFSGWAGTCSLGAVIAQDSYVVGNPGYAASQLAPSSGTNPTGAAPSSTGFTSGTGYTAPTSLFNVSNTGLTSANALSPTGGSVAVTTKLNATAGTRQSNRALTSYSTTGITQYWFSGLIQASETLGANQRAMVGFSNYADATATNQPGTTTQGVEFGLDGGNFAVIARSSNSGTSYPRTIFTGDGTNTFGTYTAGSTNFFVARLLLQTDSVGGVHAIEDRLTVWLNPSDTSSVGALGTGVSIQTNAIGSYTGAAADMTRINYYGKFINAATGGTVLIDEPRLGTTLADVAAVPEPASVGLIGLAGLVGLRRRR